MEEMEKLLTELAEQKLEAITDEEINYLLDTCNRFRKETDCFDMFRTAQQILCASLLRFIDGLEYFGTTIDHEELIQDSQRMIDRFNKKFYEYMKGRNNDKN